MSGHHLRLFLSRVGWAPTRRIRELDSSTQHPQCSPSSRPHSSAHHPTSSTRPRPARLGRAEAREILAPEAPSPRLHPARQRRPGWCRRSRRRRVQVDARDWVTWSHRSSSPGHWHARASRRQAAVRLGPPCPGAEPRPSRARGWSRVSRRRPGLGRRGRLRSRWGRDHRPLRRHRQAGRRQGPEPGPGGKVGGRDAPGVHLGRRRRPHSRGQPRRTARCSGTSRPSAPRRSSWSESGLPWTTLRATQFHDLIYTVVAGRWPSCRSSRSRSGFRFQPVDAGEVAARLVDLALGAPAGLVPDIAGPTVYGMDEIAPTATSRPPTRGDRRCP